MEERTEHIISSGHHLGEGKSFQKFHMQYLWNPLLSTEADTDHQRPLNSLVGSELIGFIQSNLLHMVSVKDRSGKDLVNNFRETTG